MNNRWNRIIYKIWSPIYDRFFNSGSFLKARQQVFSNIVFSEGQNILFVGIGTGADLELIDRRPAEITAIDYSPDMLDQARQKFGDTDIRFIEMDAQHLEFGDDEFDFVVASLILSVVPDPDRCFGEMVRVLRPGGTLLIFDKFATGESKPPLGKRLIRPVIKALGTDIGLSFENLYRRHSAEMHVIEDRPVMINGMYRKIQLGKEH
ncbi:phosphatidylethanolamine N-methyltransferase [Bhargavaea cecembensis]|uniref:Phosphatidylethanolamine N-methyltransferase n=1 Tax=Bhargavaea cecembensis TaxID=394098 RepID=A0A161SR35_9BACL|nr:class I SAM-dependent methyltransferase [Bhargavaea cecembensis]KZE37780.1 phosphatidylethanolamine N-methyltransferase [Bhargavaea cecembensis]